MASWLILLVGAIYSYISIESFVIGKIPLGLVFAGYAFSNVGLWMAAR